MAASKNSAVSATVRVTDPAAERLFQWSWGSIGTRPRCGFSPTSPQNAAGIRIEPPPSVAEAAPTSPAATAHALPPLDPPTERFVSQGLRVGPQASVSVKGWIARSESVVFARITAPAARRRRTSSPSAAAERSPNARVPNLVTVPSTSTLSLIATGDPEQRLIAVVVGDAARVRRLGLRDRPLGEHLGERVQLRVEALGPLEVEVDELAGGDLARADQLRLARNAGEREVFGVHGAILCRPRSPAPTSEHAQAGEREPAPEALEAHHPPALLHRDPGQLLVGVDDDRVGHGAQHRQVGDRVRVGV